MSASSVSRKGSVARIVAAIVAVAAISCAASDRGSLPPATGSDPSPAQSDGAIGHACLGRAPTQVLSLRDAKDVPLNLAYIRGCGWRYLHVRQPMNQPLSEPGYMRVSETAPLSAATLSGEPLTLFIDGPTGYTFVWSRDRGWKFVGEVAGVAP
jgi:hypothetical protein